VSEEVVVVVAGDVHHVDTAVSEPEDGVGEVTRHPRRPGEVSTPQLVDVAAQHQEVGRLVGEHRREGLDGFDVRPVVVEVEVAGDDGSGHFRPVTRRRYVKVRPDTGVYGLPPGTPV